MISRVAEHAYWLQRYVERSSSLARLLLVWCDELTGDGRAEADRWSSVLVTAGELPRFSEKFGRDAVCESATVLGYLTWDRECPVSIASSIEYARENARVIRETISREVWETVNREWLWLASAEARHQYDEDKTGFFRRVRDAGHQVRGAAVATMLHGEALAFMGLGMHLETADQTARIVDVTHYLVDESDAETVAEAAVWMQALLACGAWEGFMKSGMNVRARRAAAFLLLDRRFPRSLAHALAGAGAALADIFGQDAEHGRNSVDALRTLDERVAGCTVDDLFDRGIHDEITTIVDGLAAVGSALYPDFFAPALRPPPPRT